MTKRARETLDDWRNEGFPVDISTDAVIVTATATTLSTTHYKADDCVGSKLTFSNAARTAGGSGRVKSALLYDLANEGKTIDLMLFDSDPAATTFTDNSTMDINDADMPKIMGFIQIDTFSAFNDTQVGVPEGDTINLPFQCASGSMDIYGVMIASATHTYTATADLGIRLGIIQF